MSEDRKCCCHNDEHVDVARRKSLKQIVFAAVGSLLVPFGLIGKRAEAGYGECSVCSCPGFEGSGYTCTRGGCGHHYDQHW